MAGTEAGGDTEMADDGPCRSQCELAAGGCVERPLEDFEDLDGTIELWSQVCSGVDAPFPFVVSGACADGKFVVMTGGGYTVEHRYFDDEGSFVALTTGTDVIDPVCMGQGYWPERVACEEGVVTEVHCGTNYKVGDPL